MTSNGELIVTEGVESEVYDQINDYLDERFSDFDDIYKWRLRAPDSFRGLNDVRAYPQQGEAAVVVCRETDEDGVVKFLGEVGTVEFELEFVLRSAQGHIRREVAVGNIHADFEADQEGAAEVKRRLEQAAPIYGEDGD